MSSKIGSLLFLFSCIFFVSTTCLAKPSFTKAIVTNINDSSISIIQTVQPVTELARLSLGAFQMPVNVTMSPDGRFGYVLTNAQSQVHVHKIDLFSMSIVSSLSLDGVPGQFLSSGQGADLEIAPNGKLLIATERGLGGIAYIISTEGSMSELGAVATCDYLFQGNGVDCVSSLAITQVHFHPKSSEAYILRNRSNEISVIDLSTLTISRRLPIPNTLASLEVAQISGFPSLPEYLHYSSGGGSSELKSGLIDVKSGNYLDMPIGGQTIDHFADAQLIEHNGEYYGIAGDYGNFLTYFTGFAGPAHVYIRHLKSGSQFSFPMGESAQQVLLNLGQSQVWSVCPITGTGACANTEIRVHNLASNQTTVFNLPPQHLLLAGIPGFSHDFSHYFYPVRGTDQLAYINTSTLQLSYLTLAASTNINFGGVGMFRAQGDSSSKIHPQ